MRDQRLLPGSAGSEATLKRATRYAFLDRYQAVPAHSGIARLTFLGDNRGEKAAMTIQLKPEQEHRIAEALRSGAYGSPDDVIDHALEVLHERDEWLTTNRQAIDAKIQAGIAELERGEGIPEDELDAYLALLKAQPE